MLKGFVVPFFGWVYIQAVLGIGLAQRELIESFLRSCCINNNDEY